MVEFLPLKYTKNLSQNYYNFTTFILINQALKNNNFYCPAFKIILKIKTPRPKMTRSIKRLTN